MSTTALVALNVLNLLTGGAPVTMAKHRATESKPSSSHTKVPAPKCPHGHFERWAKRNCKACNG